MNKSKLKIIKDIEKEVPQEWRDKLMTEQYVAPDIRQTTVEQLEAYPDELKKLTGDELIQETKHYKRLQNLFDAGYYDAKEKVVDEKYAKKIEDFVEKGINKAIKDGRLPKPKKDDELLNYVKKIQRNEKRKQKSSVRSK